MNLDPSPVRSAASGWACPRCGSDRAADDAFCGRCGTRRPAGAPQPATESERAGALSSPVARALILNGIIIGAVVLAVAFGGGQAPGPIAFEPATWRCDRSERAWSATIPARAQDLRIEWRSGGPEGAPAAESRTTRLALEPFLVSDGAFRVTTSDPTGPECELEPGTYTMVIRDATNSQLLASGDVTLAAP